MHRKRETINSLTYHINVILKRRLQETLKEFGITTEQWVVLGRINDHNGEYNQKELSDQTNKESASITRIIDKLEKKDLVRRERSETDRREYKMYITDAGRELYESTLPKTEKEENEVETLLTGPERESLIKYLSMILSKLE